MKTSNIKLYSFDDLAGCSEHPRGVINKSLTTESFNIYTRALWTSVTTIQLKTIDEVYTYEEVLRSLLDNYNSLSKDFFETYFPESILKSSTRSERWEHFKLTKNQLELILLDGRSSFRAYGSLFSTNFFDDPYSFQSDLHELIGDIELDLEKYTLSISIPLFDEHLINQFCVDESFLPIHDKLFRAEKDSKIAKKVNETALAVLISNIDNKSIEPLLTPTHKKLSVKELAQRVHNHLSEINTLDLPKVYKLEQILKSSLIAKS